MLLNSTNFLLILKEKELRQTITTLKYLNLT
ncbi:hypothetical protein SAMN05444280_12312 [Tangfeifania diversioriginum]|uniref:Uncharacterized protein n=1 Tax=Tangfeifania diversioriginum TaxID=1168035 RepID=A0A1M6KEI5_9BACT|nr:hypothetical protein SAMN05444280_12312 [Tangfeifania diversioriginum]